MGATLARPANQPAAGALSMTYAVGRTRIFYQKRNDFQIFVSASLTDGEPPPRWPVSTLKGGLSWQDQKSRQSRHEDSLRWMRKNSARSRARAAAACRTRNGVSRKTISSRPMPAVRVAIPRRDAGRRRRNEFCNCLPHAHGGLGKQNRMLVQGVRQLKRVVSVPGLDPGTAMTRWGYHGTSRYT